jgi:hypothetical protein
VPVIVKGKARPTWLWLAQDTSLVKQKFIQAGIIEAFLILSITMQGITNDCLNNCHRRRQSALISF